MNCFHIAGYRCLSVRILYRKFASSSKIDKNGVLTSINGILDSTNKTRVIERLKSIKPIKRPDLKFSTGYEAGILVPMCHVDGEPSILFMVRSLHLKTHGGEISFPGGMHDDGDKDIVYTALRETNEEIGLDSSKVDVWGTLPPIPSRVQLHRKGGSKVTPVIGYCDIADIKDLKLNPAEVESVFTRTIVSLCDTGNVRQTQWRYPGTKGYTIPVFLGGDHRIWGLTAMVLHQTLNVLAPNVYKFKLKHRS